MIDREAAIRSRMVALAVQMYASRFIHGRAGNLSARLSDGSILCTPAGVNKADLQPDQLLVIDAGGRPLRGLPGLKPTS
ncbi:MAG: class II aldolase/adducin family protein, partial [Anaerolineales bacterium]|nr:class II aldolase/adducin family protein [Anaerolineales bacterium]